MTKSFDILSRELAILNDEITRLEKQREHNRNANHKADLVTLKKKRMHVSQDLEGYVP